VSKEKSVKLIIFDDSFNNEEKFASLIRSFGIAAHTVRVEDDEDFEEALKKTTPDLIIYKNGMELIDLPGIINILKTHKLARTSVLVLASDGAENDVNIAMSQGANDLIDFNDEAHLKNILQREIRQMANNKRLASLEDAYTESEKRCSSLMDSSRDAIAYIHEGMHIYSNQSYLELFGLEENEDLEGTPILDMVGTDDQDSFKKFLRKYSTEAGTATLESNLRNADGTEFKGKIEFSPASIEGEPCIQIIIRNEVDQKELEKQINMLSQRDQVTGLYNRQFFMDSLEKTIATVKKESSTAALLYISLDNFHGYKDKLGVIGSDQLLIDVAQLLKQSCKDDDIVCRFHGHHFTIITSNISDRASAEKCASKLRENIEEFTTTINGIATTTTATIGISLIESEAPDSSEILLRAEKAADESQALGPNKIALYIPKEGELTQKEIDSQVSQTLLSALKNNMFVLYYQPVISLHGDIEERYEVYIRMKDKSGKLIMPDEFIPAAERSGMMAALDRWVISTAINKLVQQKKAKRNTKFFIKLSQSSLIDEKLLPWLEEKLHAASINKGSIIFEIKESIAVTNLKHSKALADGLAALDCSFALDDFGTGMNPFQLLKHIPADYLKIESSFMENLSTNTQNQETVKNITETATKMNKMTIAQCIHDASSLSVLWGMGVNFIQGHFLQEPMPELNYDFSEMAG
jgi:diguanylate cyclase (GGDEF)-like protein/PAS domain S-box-containing protein